MGYDTKFRGEFKISPFLKPKDAKDFLRIYRGQRFDRGSEGSGVPFPSLYCQWDLSPIINETDQYALTWDGKEKFYSYLPWLEYLITHFFKPRGYYLNGIVYWKGMNFSDVGKITVASNLINSEFLIPQEKK